MSVSTFSSNVPLSIVTLNNNGLFSWAYIVIFSDNTDELSGLI